MTSAPSPDPAPDSESLFPRLDFDEFLNDFVNSLHADGPDER